jgi:WD40 repeat protein
MHACLVLLLALLLMGSALAEKAPDQRPFLRIEAGMHTAMIRRIGLSADGQLLATGSEDRTVRLWALPEGRLVRTLRLPVNSGIGGMVFAVALSPDGKLAAAGGWDIFDGSHYVYLFNSNTGSLDRRLGPLPNVVDHLRFSPDGRRLIAGLGRKGIRVWAPKTGKLLGQDTDYGDEVRGADFAADGRLAVASWDGLIRLYDAGLRRTKRVDAPGGKRPNTIAFAPNAERLAVGYIDTNRVDILAADTLEPIFAADTAGLDNGDLSAVAWSADGHRLFASGSYYDSNFERPIFTWDGAGKGQRDAWPGPQNRVVELLPTRACCGLMESR